MQSRRQQWSELLRCVAFGPVTAVAGTGLPPSSVRAGGQWASAPHSEGVHSIVIGAVTQHLFVTVLLTLAFAWTPVALSAQDEAVKPATGLKLGKIEGDFQRSTLTPKMWHFVGHVTITSEQYDLAAEDIQVFLLPGKGGKASASALEKATADGAADRQVDVHVRRPLESQAYEILADHAVYLPEKVRPGYGRMDFTGHVSVITRSGFLDGPSVATTDKATVLLGPGNGYPQLTTGPAHITVTPAQ